MKTPLLARGLTLLGLLDRMVAFMVMVGEDGAGDGVRDVSRWYGAVASSMSFCNMARRRCVGFLMGGMSRRCPRGLALYLVSRGVKVRAWLVQALCSEGLAE